MVWMDTSKGLGIAGAIDTEKCELSAGMKLRDMKDTMNGMNYVFADRTSDETEVSQETFVVCVEVIDGWVSVWEKQTPNKKVEVGLSGTYTGGSVSLFSNDGAKELFVR